MGTGIETRLRRKDGTAIADLRRMVLSLQREPD
jgi:hypothetical protein